MVVLFPRASIKLVIICITMPGQDSFIESILSPSPPPCMSSCVLSHVIVGLRGEKATHRASNPEYNNNNTDKKKKKKP